MTELELKEKIKTLVKVIKGEKKKVNLISQEYDELTKFPELKKVIVDLLTSDFDNFWTQLQSFYIIYHINFQKDILTSMMNRMFYCWKLN
jgi:hypothetical protein